MKIAQISHVYLPHIGGIEFYVYRLVRDLKAQGHKVEVITTDMDTPKENRKKEAKYFHSKSFMRNPYSKELNQYLRENSFDILHLHSIWFLPSLFAVLNRKNAKIITTLHGVYPDKLDFKLKIFLALYKPFAKYVLNKSEKIIVLSNSEKERLIKIFKINPDKVEVIANGIDVEEHKSIKNKEKIILFTGRIIPDKNPDILIKAAAQLKEKGLNFKVNFIGPIDKEYLDSLLKLAEDLKIKDEVFFSKPYDPISDKKLMLSAYRGASVFISLGSWEGLPTRLMEAMQFEVPCITYSSGGSSELVKDNVNGYVINALDSKLLADKIEKILKNKNEAERLGKNARITIKKYFNWDNLQKKIRELY